MTNLFTPINPALSQQEQGRDAHAGPLRWSPPLPASIAGPVVLQPDPFYNKGLHDSPASSPMGQVLQSEGQPLLPIGCCRAIR